jgi:type IV secretory pathway VirB10-like protein
MNGSNGIEFDSAPTDAGQTSSAGSAASDGKTGAEIATRGGQRKRPTVEQKQIVIVAAGGLILALLAFILVATPHKPRTPESKSIPMGQRDASGAAPSTPGRSSVPVTEATADQGKGDRSELLREQDVQRTAAPEQKSSPLHPSTPPESASGRTLGAIPSFDGDPEWQVPPYGSNSPNSMETPETLKSDRDLLAKPSLVFVRNAASANATNRAESTLRTVGLGLPTGTRLRARLETVATSAVKLPAIAVIEYNYERNGQILIPAGTKAMGHVEQADRTGFMSIRFDTLMMPDGTEVPFEAVATDLGLGPLRGRVQGKNTGKTILARSLAGVGQAGALFAGRGSLNQPLSEQDLIRERVATNIGDESDREISRVAITEHIVVSVPAGTPIYVVLQQTTKQPLPAIPQNLELLQLLQKQLSGAPGSESRKEQ